MKRFKFLSFLTLLIFLACSIVSAETLQTTSSNTFTKGVDKNVEIDLTGFSTPASAWDSKEVEIISGNASIVGFSTDDPNKLAASNLTVDPKRVIGYGLNNLAISGKFTVTFNATTDDQVQLRIGNNKAAASDASGIQVDDLVLTFNSDVDYNGDGVVDGQDVVFVVDNFLTQTGVQLEIDEIQALINLVLGL